VLRQLPGQLPLFVYPQHGYSETLPWPHDESSGISLAALVNPHSPAHLWDTENGYDNMNQRKTWLTFGPGSSGVCRGACPVAGFAAAHAGGRPSAGAYTDRLCAAAGHSRGRDAVPHDEKGRRHASGETANVFRMGGLLAPVATQDDTLCGPSAVGGSGESGDKRGGPEYP
jgi:hypothetical protein